MKGKKPVIQKGKLEFIGLTLIGMREGTFIFLSFLDWTLSAEFLSKIFKKTEPNDEHFSCFRAHANENKLLKTDHMINHFVYK